MAYIFDNKEWIFSGIGVFIISMLFIIIKKKLKKRKTKPVKSKFIKSNTRNINQYGNKSTYIEKNDGDITIY